LSDKDRSYLETQTKARTIQAQTVTRARILLLKADGMSIDAIADKVDMNRKSIMLCINKYLEKRHVSTLQKFPEGLSLYSRPNMAPG